MDTAQHTTSTTTTRVLLTVEAAADRLSVGRTTMYALIKAGHITTVRVGRLRRIPADALTAYTHRLTEGALA
ncbi:transcriptional regulator [Saccharomonospora sp. CUA-673]|uniref:excisionase family DNA-binding protein n=1 Tax=Saccharomonospora sp. CUA-673 TaxID=1904969 RepID=UPI00095CAF74|nr:excisionase family DNA-binding protein [Saccharomonospora sp. CUA-673]OLT39086.1 transcriptional regulator [Saccharomonospora sp. CUA-673]